MRFEIEDFANIFGRQLKDIVLFGLRERDLRQAGISLSDLVADGFTKEHFDKLCEELTRIGQNFTVDPMLVRGLDYYTKTAFEVQTNALGSQSAILGGGRYDNLIGKFTGESVPAVGFSIGFERIFSILKDRAPLQRQKKVAVIYEDGNFIESLKFQKSIQDEFTTSLFERPKKLGKLLNKLEELKYFGFVVFSEGTTIKQLNNN